MRLASASTTGLRPIESRWRLPACRFCAPRPALRTPRLDVVPPRALPAWAHGDEVEEGGDDHTCGYVALVGLPNAGKSTLSNRLLGQRYSIVTRKPNTTRQRVLGIRTEGKSQLILLDTPGVVVKQNSLLDTSMMKAVTSAVSDADAILLIVDASDRPYDTIKLLRPPDGGGDVPVSVVLNKIDLIDERDLDELTRWIEDEKVAGASIATCGTTGEGTGELLRWCMTHVPHGPWLYPEESISDHPERFFVAEIVREKLIVQYDEEIPYASHVTVSDFKERKKGKDYIAIEIAVERESQKKILIGRNGGALKKLCTGARLDIEQFLMRPVYLEVNVKVKKDWRKSSADLRSLGLYESMQ